MQDLSPERTLPPMAGSICFNRKDVADCPQIFRAAVIAVYKIAKFSLWSNVVGVKKNSIFFAKNGCLILYLRNWCSYKTGMKRLLTLALSLGFFIWLPSAFADGDGLSLNAPATFRQVQVLPEGGSSLLTLNVNNIQVRAAWEVSEPNSVFTISAGGSPNEGVLKATAEATGPHVVTVYAVDQFELLNPAYVNLTASAVITVVFESGNKFGFVDVPLLRLSVIEGSGDSIYTFVVTNGVAPYIYGVAGVESGYFSISPPQSGELFLAAATVGIYTLSVTVDDSETPSNSYTAQVIVDVRPRLSLAMVPRLTAFAGKAEVLHIITAGGGIGEYVYKFDDGVFRVNPQSGDFFVRSNATPKTYMLTVLVEDKDEPKNEATVTVTVVVLPGVALKGGQIPDPLAHGQQATVFVANGGNGPPYTYNLVDGNGSDNFDLGTGGTLSVKIVSEAGTYTLIVAVVDTRDNSATARITLEIARELTLRTMPLPAVAGLMMTVHTFEASGGVGAKRYTLISQTSQSKYFSVNDESGELVLAGDKDLKAGQYILVLDVSDPNERITVTVTVNVERNAIFVLGGRTGESAYENDVWWSVDGNSWLLVTNTAAWSARYEHQVAGYGARLYVSGGEDNNGIKTELMYSVNGKDWLDDGSLSWQTRTQHQVVEHQGSLYILGGETSDDNYEDDVWSTDGNSWQQRTSSAGWTAKQGYQVVSHQGRLYKLGGANDNTRTNNVWSSADGMTWIFEGEADWSGRDNHQAVSHQGRIYVLGGYDGRNRLSDVWSSADGRSWTPEGNADWPARDSYQAVSHQGRIYVLGGNDGSRKNDVWSSADGNSWNLVQGGAGWSARDGLQAVVFPPPLVILGASEKINLVAGTGADLYTFSARYGFGNYAYSLADGTDADFKINNGVLSMDGDLDAGLYTVIVWVTDEEGTRAQTAIIIELFNFTLADVPMKLVAYAGSSEEVELYTLAAVYGVEPYTYNLVNESQLGTFTVGATSGILSVLPSASVGVYTVPVEVEDGDGNSATAVATVELSENLSLADAQRLSVVAGKALILHTFSADGGAGTPTYDLLNHKNYFTVDGDSGILSVQAVSEVGVYTLSVEASDGEGSQATARATVDVLPRLSLADASLLIAVEKKAVSLHMFSASGGIGGKTYTFVAVAGDDTKYFSLNITSGVLSLQADANAGKYMLTVEVKDERDNRDEAVATVNISMALSLADAGLLKAAVGVAKDLYTFEASGGLGAKTYTLTAVAPYFMVGSASGVLSVNNSAPLAIYTVSVQVTDASGDMAVALATVEMVSLLLESALDLYAIVGRTVSLHTFDALGGIDPNTYTIVSGDGKEYFTLGKTNGILSVQVSATVGIYTLSVKVEDGGGNESEALAVVVVASSLSLAGVSYEDAVPAFSRVAVSVYTFIASGGIGAKTYTLVMVTGGGANEFAVDAANGVLSVVNAQAGRSELIVRVSDSRGNTAEAVIGVEVKDRLLLTEVPLLKNFARLSVTVVLHTLVDSGGEGTKRYTMIADESGYFTVGADNGELSLPPNPVMPAGTYTLLVEVSDAGSPIQRATAAVTVQLASNGIFVLGGQSGSTTNENENDVWSSVDGETWKEQADAGWSQRRYHQAVAHNGRLYVLGGRGNGSSDRKNDVWYSVDGENWTLVTDDADWDAREKHQAVAHNGRIYVLGGYDGSDRLSDVWSSADGKSWDQVTDGAAWPIREDHQAVVHNGRIYVLGGFDGGDVYNDVWSSADGNTWRFEGNAAWGARYIHQAVSHAGRLYVLGGSVLGDYNDVWSSVDGRSWVQEQANESNFWSQRSGHQSLSRDGLLYVLGGNDGSANHLSDVWPSADGVEWGTPTEADWTGRQRHQAVVFPSPLALVGTSETITLTARVDAGAIHTFIAQHGLGDPAYELAPNDLGFSIGDDGVLLANNISQTGLYVLTVRVEDQEGAKAESVVNLEVLSFALADAPPISFLAGLSTEKELHTFTPVYGVEEYTYNLSGKGAEHFTLGNNGVLSANANVVTVGIYILSAKVTDGNGNQATAVARVEAVPQVSLDDALPLSLVAAKVTVLHTFEAKDGIGTHTYNLLNERGSFTVVADSGVLSSRATTAAKTYVLMVEVRDGEGGGSQATALVTVEVRPRLVLTDTERLIAVERKAKDLHTFTSIGGIGAATYTLTTGNGAEYFALNATSGVLSLSAEAVAGQYMLTVGVKDERANSDEKIVAVNISAALSLLLSDDAKPISNRENQAQDNLYTFEASGGIGIKTYTLVVDVAHFKVNAAGVLAVDADASAGDYTLSVEVSDADDNRASVVATVQLVALYLSDIDSLYAIVGRNVDLHTFDGGDAAQNYVITDGNVGSYFTLDSQSGVLAVQDTALVGIYTLSVVVEDGSSNRSEAARAVVEVRLSLLLADAPRLTAVAEFAASLHTFVAAHGGDGKAYTIEGGDTDGNFVLNAASGVLSLRAESAAGLYTLTVQAADERDSLVTAVATVEVSAALRLADALLLVADAGDVVSLTTFTASGGIGVKTYTLVAGNEDKYFAINATSGVLSVVSAEAMPKVYTLSVRAIDRQGYRVEARGLVSVRAVLALNMPAAPLRALARLSVTVILHQFTASNGIGTKQYAIADDEGYFAIDEDSGVLSLPVNNTMVAGDYILNLVVSDSDVPPQQVTSAVEVRIIPNGLFVLGGNDAARKNDVWSLIESGDWGQDTAAAGWPARDGHQAVPYKGRLYVLGGNSGSRRNDVWSSADGSSWQVETAANWPARDGHQAVAHNERIYVLGGNDGTVKDDVWWWDGSSWQEGSAADWPARESHQAVSHNGRIYVLGGEDEDGDSLNDVWSSADGSSWEQETAAAGWTVRVGHQAVAHKGRIYVLGGKDKDGNVLKDVWSSFDGENWSEETAAAQWDARTFHMARSYRGRLYISSGQGSGDTTLKDIWSSADGKTWQPETSADWAERYSHQMAVFPQPLILTNIIERAELARNAIVEIHTFAAQHGFPDYSYSLVPDPLGFKIDENTGVLEADGNADPREYVFNVRVEDQDGAQAETKVKIEVIGFSLADAPRLSVLADSATAVSVYTFVAAYGRAPYTYELASGTGSNNFILAANGVLSVKASTAQGEYILAINANDASTGRDSAVATVIVVPRVALGDTQLSVVAAKALVLHTLTAMDGLGTYTYNLLNKQEYFTVVATSGVLSSRSTVVVGGYALNVEVRDGAGSQATAQVMVNVRARLAVVNAPLLVGTENRAKTLHKFVSSGGIGVATYTLFAGNADYFFMGTAGDLILLTAAVKGRYTVTVRATDERDNTADAVATVNISAALLLADAPLISAAVRTAADLHMFEASGGVGVKTYDLEAGASYFSVISTSGLLAVNDQAPASVYSLTVKATDTDGNEVLAVATVVVSRLFLADAEIYGIANTQADVYIFDGGADAETYSIVFGKENYFVLNPQSGVFSVQTAPLGIYTLSIAAYNAAGDGVLAKAVVEITMAVSLANAPPLTVVADAAVSLHTFAASHGFGIKTYAFAAGNGAGHFDLNALSGVLSLRADAVADVYTLSVRATDEYGNWGEAMAVVDVSAALQMAETPPLTVSVAIGEDKIVTTYVATGGLGAKTYMVTYMVVALENFTINGETGALSVVNAPQTGFYTLSVQAVDQRGITVEVQSTVHVKGELLLADATTRLDTFARLSVVATLHTFAAIGGLGAKSYDFKDESGYFHHKVVGDNIILSLPVNSAMLEGTYTVSLVVSDSDMPPQQRTATAEILIAKNGLVILGGADVDLNPLNDVWSSADGRTWVEVTEEADWPARYVHQAVAHNGRLYVLGGFGGGDKNDVWSSADGRTWTEETAAAEWSARNGHQAVAHQGQIYVLGGSGKNDVWSSADGKSWTEVTVAAGWSARSEHQAVSHNSRLYVLGGLSGSTPLRDVWSSADGRTWSRDTETAGWVARNEHQVVSHQGRLYVLGGWRGSSTPFKDVWSSADGKDWVVEPAADWQERYGHQVQSYRGSLYLSLGQANDDELINDIWSSADGSDWQQGTVGGWSGGRFSHQMEVFPPAMVLFGISQPVVLNLGASSPELHTYSARYGGGAYTYTLVSDSNAFDLENRVLKSNSNLAEGNYTLTVIVTDAEGSMDQNVVKIQAQNNFAVVDVPPLYAEANVTAAVGLHTFAAVQGTAPITFTIFSGNEGEHFTLNAESSELFVQNASVAIYTLGVRAEDSRSPTRRRVEVFVVVDVNYPLALAGAEVTIQTGITAGFYTLSVSGGGGVRTFAVVGVVEGGDPRYFSINANGVLQVSNAVVTTYALAVEVRDESGGFVQARIDVDVVPQMSLVAVPILAAVARLSMAVTVHTFSVTAGVGKLRYTLIADESGYLTLNADSGVLLLPENPDMLAGTYSLQVLVSDSLPVPQLATAVATLRILKNGIFVMGGSSGSTVRLNDVWAAADGNRWAKVADANWPIRSDYQAVVYQGRMYVLGGYGGSSLGDVWSSADGKNWTPETNPAWDARLRFQAVSHNGRLYVLGGGTGTDGSTLKNDVWSWAEGESWMAVTVSAAWEPRRAHQAVSHNGRLYVLGGGYLTDGTFRDDVWSSVDGATWSFEGNAGWPIRISHQAVSHNGRLYVLGGNVLVSGGSNSPRNDVWSWAEGEESWRQEQANGASSWSKRDLFKALSHDGLLYVMGGEGSARENDVWSSADGVSWTEVTGSADWVARRAFQAVVFPPNLELLGASETIILTLEAGLEIYTFSAQYGGGEYKYSLPLDPEGFNIDGDGVLSANDEEVPAGIYLVTVRVNDGDGSQAESVINIELRSFALADAPALTAATALPATVKVHTFSAIYGVGEYTYAIASGNVGDYFSLGENSGELAVVNAAVGIYTLFVAVEDEVGSSTEAVATVVVKEFLALADVPLLGALAASTMSIYTFIPANLDGAATYTLVSGNAAYFSVNPSSGVLSVANAAAGFYTVTVEVSDGTDQAQVGGVVQVVLPVTLADLMLETPKATMGATLTVTTFSAIDGFGAKRYAILSGNQAGYFAVGGGDLLLVGNDAMLAGHYTLSVEVTDSLVPPQRATAAVVVNILRNATAAQIMLMGGEDDSPQKLNDVWTSANGEIWESQPNADWTKRTEFQAVFHNGRVYVMGGVDADGSKQDVWSTADGSSWDYEGEAAWTMRRAFVAVSHKGRIYVMGGNSADGVANDVWSSADGRSWVPEGNADWDARYLFDGMSHNGRIYVLGGYDGTRRRDVWWSEDGQTWNEATSDAGWGRNSFSAASHNGRMYMTGGNSGSFHNDVWSSEDGTTWVLEKANDSTIGWDTRDNHQVFSFDGLLYVVGGRLNSSNDKANDIWSSADGKSWTEVTDEAAWPARNVFDVAVGEGTFLAIIADRVVSFSPNYNGEIYQVSARFGFGKYTYSLESTVGFTIDQNGRLSADGSHDAGRYTVTVRVEDAERLQAETQIILDSDLLSLADASPQHIFTRLKNTVVLHTFAATGGGKPYTYNFVSGDAGYFTLDEKSGVLTFPANENATAGNYVLVVKVRDNLSGQANARITVQLDGGRKMFVLGGSDGTVYLDDVWSYNGAWTEETASAEWDPVGYAQTVPHKGLLYKIGGRAGSNSTSNSVWSSKDAKNWTRAGSAGSVGRVDSQAASLNGRLYVAGGASTSTNYRRDVFSSEDGKSWVQETANANWPGREGHQMVAFNGRLYVMGGETGANTFSNDVWSSSNGRDWEFEGNADWSVRAKHQAVVHEGRIYVMGGSNGSALDDVWSSDDGKNWELEKDNAKWTARQDFAAVSFDLSGSNFIWIMGGSDGSTNLDDAWASLNGESWVKPPVQPQWSARVGFDAVVFPPRLALYGLRGTIQLAESAQTTVIHTFTAEYGLGALNYSLEPGHNANFSMDSNGVLTANENLAIGSYTLTAKVVDSESTEAKAEIRIRKNTFKVADAPPRLAYSKLAIQQGLHTFRPSGGTAPYTYRIFTQGPFVIGENNGVLALPAGDTKAGSYPLLVRVRDSGGLNVYPRVTVNVVKNRMVVLAGYNQNGDAWESEDGVSWRTNILWGFSHRRNFPAVSHRGSVFAMGGYVQHRTPNQQKVVYHSATGRDGWGLGYNAPWSARDSHDAASNGDKMYLMGGNGNKQDVWSTVNGSTWSLVGNADWPGRSGLQVVWHNGRLYVLGGITGGNISDRKNDVWSSVDGSSWRFEGNADWVARERHQAFSHKGWIYVLGGVSTDSQHGGRKNDVWRSLDGRSWEQVKASGNGSWDRRHSHQAFALDGRLYLMGGTNHSNTGFPNAHRLNDVWSSADDGVTWTLLGNANWDGRIGFGALAFPPNLVVHGPTSDVITVSVGVTPDIMFTARDGYTAEPYTYELKPKMAGFNINSDGVLSVDEDAEGGFHRMTVLVTDGEGTQAETIVRVDVHALQIVDVPQLTAVVRLPVAVSLHTFTGAFGQGTYTYNLVGGNVAGYFDLDAGGDLSLLQNDQMRGGLYDLLVEVSDSVPRQATAVVQVRLLPGQVYVLGGYDGTKQLNDVWSSFDNKTWKREVANANWPARQDSQVVVYKGRLYVLGGHDGSTSLNDVWSSADGKNWSFEGTADWPARGEHQAVVYKGRLYVLGGYEGSNHPYLNDFTGSRLNDVWSSADGKSWSFEGNADWTARSGHATAVHNDVLYVLGGQPGFLNDEVWSSVDGQNWSFEGDANWFFRRWFQAQSFNSRLYVLGGDAGGGRGDIWSSADGSSLGGKSWLEVRGSGSGVGWSDRGGHQALLYQDLMYVLGGSSFSNELNDVWSSGDGRNWTKVADAGWSKRDSHQAVTFPPSLALAGTNEHFILSVGVAESAIATVTAQHGFGDYTYSLAPGTGKGFTFDSNTRVLSNDGSSIRGSYWVTVQVTDEDGALAETVIRVDVHGLFLAAPPPILIYGGIDLGGANLPAQDLHTFVAAEGVEPYTYALKEIATQDINFFTIEATSGVLAAKEAIPAPRTYNIGVEVTDGDGTKVQVNVKVVASPVLSLTDAPTVNLFIDEIAPTVTLHTFAAGGGIGAKVYNIVSVNADGHFSLDRNSGVLSAVSLTVGAYTLAVRVSDSRGSNVGAQAVVRILEPFLSAVPPLVFLPPKSMSVTLYNFTGGSIGKKVHIFLGGDRNYFNLGEESGILSAKPNTPAGTYVLRIGIVDTGAGGADPQQVIVTVYLVDNGIFVLGGNDGALRNDVWMASANGAVWGPKTTDAGWPGRTFSQAVLHNERIYVLGGEGTDTNGNKVRYNDVWSSADEGITWEFHGNANWPGRSEHQAVSHNGGLYVLGGTNGSSPLKDVWSSTDGGATWQPKATPPWSIRRLHQAVSHNGRIYITGGHHHTAYRNDMWSSADGANWTRDSVGGWLKRKGAAAVSHNGRIYLMGGSDGDKHLNNVWSSADGISWRQETAAAEWSAREVHQAVSRNGLLYVMGGTSGGNEVWSSADGKSWTIVTGNANWTARIGHQAVVMPRSFSLLGAPGRVALTANVAASNIHTFQGQNGTPAYTYSFLGAAPGFGIGRSSGVLSVDDSLVTSVVYAVTVQVQDADGRRTQAEANIEALAPLPLVLLPGTDEILTVTSRIVRNIHTFRASQGSAGYAYLLKPLITGFAIGSNGVLSTDNNLAAGIYTVIVQVSDKKGATPAQTSITVDVRGFKLLGFGTKVWGQGNEDPIHAFQTEYGVAPYSYELHGGDSNWFQLKKSNKTSNILHIKFGRTPLPPAKVYKNIIVRVQDGRGLPAEVTVRVDVRAVALPAFSDAPLDGGRYYSDIANKDIKAQYGAPPYTYTLSPPVTGYSIDPISGALEATGEGALGTYTITVKVTDSKGKPATRGLVVRVRAPSASAARLISFPNNSIISPSALSHPPRVRHGDLAPPPQVRGVRIIHHLTLRFRGGCKCFSTCGGWYNFPYYDTPREFAMATSHPPTSAEGENYLI